MAFLKMFYSFFVFFLLTASFQSFSEAACRPDFFLTPLEELEFSPETVNSLPNKGVRTFSDLLTEEERELTEPGKLTSLLSRLQEALALRMNSPINIQEIQRIFSIKSNYAKYRWQAGYLLFVERTPNANNMNYIFSLVSKALGEDFKQLGWQSYHGFLEDFSKERVRVLSFDGSVREEYRGMSGYGRYAKKYYEENMQKAFINVSAVLESSLFKQLGWQQYHGFLEDFSKERVRVLSFDGSVREEYKGMSGYGRYAKEYHGEDMQKAFKNVSAVLESSLFKQLGWQSYRGSLEDFSKERARVLNFDGSVREEYRGMSGYGRYAKEYHGEDMQKAFINVSAVLESSLFKQCGWQQYQGSLEGFSKERARVLNFDGSVREEYRGMSGYGRYAKEYHGEDMQKAFKNVSAVLESSLFKQCGWQQYQGSLEGFSKERARVLNFDGSVREEYRGMSGYGRYAKKYHGEDMQKAFINVSAVLESSLFKQLGWQSYHGSTEEFSKEREQILNSDGSVKEKYKGMSGYGRYAKEYHGENMEKAFVNVSAVLESSLFKQLGWQSYRGSLEDFSKERVRVLNFDGSVREEYKGMSGYGRYAKEYHGENMEKAFVNVSAVLESSLFKQLGWQSYRGSLEDFSKERARVLNFDGSVREEYRGMSGYGRYAKEYHGENMEKAFVNVSAVLESSLFKQLGWQSYRGSLEDFSRERDRVLNFDGSVREEYRGMSGYGRYAKEYHGENMQKAFKNVSAVLGGYWGMKEAGLNWKHFIGSVSEYDNLLQLFEVNKAMDFAGIEGQRRVAEEIFGGDKKRAYLNVSLFREILVGSKKPLKDTMGWLPNLR